MMRCVIWAAVSTKRQAKEKERAGDEAKEPRADEKAKAPDQIEKASIPDQIKKAREVIASQGWREVHDPLVVPGHTRNYGGVSPLTDAAADMPAYADLLSLAREQAFDVLICRSRDRLGRSAALIATLERYLAEHSIQVYSLEMPTTLVDPDQLRKGTDRSSIWTSAIERARSEDEVAQLRMRHDFGMRNRVKNKGLHSGRLPLGYRKGPDGVAVVHEPEAEVIRMIYRWFLEGMSLTRILTRLPDYTTDRCPVNASSIAYILRNPFYAGLVTWSRTGRGGKPKPRHEWIVAEGKHEPIIDRDRWERTQRELESRTDRLAPRTTYPLSGLVFCGFCGRRMKTNVSGRTVRGAPYTYRYYICGKPGCKRNTVRADHLEDMVADWILQVTRDSETLQNEIRKGLGRGIDTLAAELEHMERTLLQKRAALDRWAGDYEGGLLSRVEYYSHHARLTDEISGLQRKIDEARRSHREPEDIEAELAWLAGRSYEDMAQSWLEHASEVRTHLANAGVRITVKDRDMEVVLAQ